MKKIDAFTNKYPLSKTIRFKLIPIGETYKFFQLNKMLEEDEERAEHYTVVKNLIDDYHRDFIGRAFAAFEQSASVGIFADKVSSYAGLYRKADKDDKEKAALRKAEESLRKDVAKILSSAEGFDSLFKGELITEKLPDYLGRKGDRESKDIVERFKGFSTYFTGFFNNRKNIYLSEEKATAIAYRCINENLPKFLDNAKVFLYISEALPDALKNMNKDFYGIYGTSVEDLFDIDYFPFVLSQSGIDRYNSVIGGYTCSNGTKIKGLNEYVNLYNQSANRTERIPKLKQLYKQVLSKKETISFIPEKFESDEALLSALKEFYACGEEKDGLPLEECACRIRDLFGKISEYDAKGIFVKNSLDLTTVCAGAFGYFGAVQNAWNDEYDAKKQGKNKDSEKYIDARKKAFKSVESFCLSEIQKYGEKVNPDADVTVWFHNTVTEKCETVIGNYKNAERLITEPYRAPKKLCVNDDAIVTIKEALDAVKELEKFLMLLAGTGKEENKDEEFYGEFFELYDRIRQIDGLYDKVRNYMTQKPYKTDKIKLNFKNPQFLGGWDRNKESDYSSALLRKDGQYYLCIMNKDSKDVFKGVDYYSDGEDEIYEKMIYKQIPNAAKYISSKQILPQNPPKDIVEILKKKKADNKSLNDAEIRKFIEYCKSDFLKNYPLLLDEFGKNYFDFVFKESNEYKTLNEFFLDVEKQAYSMNFVNIRKDYVDSLVREGKIYLFRIYSKDFSEKSKGTPNLHTMYFKMLFDRENLRSGSIALNGGAEMFFRRASIKDGEKIIHPKDRPVKNKNPDNKKAESVFSYDIIKDRRYTVDQFMLHLPITLNFTADGGSNLNLEVRKARKNHEDNYVIGIDRGERNLLYVCVINGQGKIVEQFSLNEIINAYKENTCKTDYHALLEKREKERKESRENWKSVESIKELKEGYISQVVHRICQLVEKYDAVIAMEDLNSGFKRVRGGKFERSVYQKFEKMLIDKLNYFADKKKSPDEMGSVLHAYQLTKKFESFKSMGKQNGFVFYVPAYLTSKIDPTTGFADLLHPRYESVAAAKDFIAKFDDIAYNREQDLFEFSFDYDRFPKAGADHRKKWTVCTYGKRIRTFRNAEKNNEWDNESVDLTAEFKKLFENHGLDYCSDLKNRILTKDNKDFYEGFIRLLALTLQMRNSVTGNTEIDYLISPVRNSSGKFYCSDDYKNDDSAKLPRDADANGAYNIARKALWVIEQFKSCRDDQELSSVKLAISNAEWLEFAQSNE